MAICLGSGLTKTDEEMSEKAGSAALIGSVSMDFYVMQIIFLLVAFLLVDIFQH